VKELKKLGIKKLNKKASLRDLLFISGFLLLTAIVILVGYKLTNEINSQIATMDDIPARAITAGNTLEGFYPSIIDNSFLFLTVLIGIVALILAALVRIHPIFIPLFIIALVFIIFLSGVHSNIYQEMAANTHLSTLASNLTFTSLIMQYIPFIIGIFGILLMVVQYKLWQTQQ